MVQKSYKQKHNGKYVHLSIGMIRDFVTFLLHLYATYLPRNGVSFPVDSHGAFIVARKSMLLDMHLFTVDRALTLVL